ncbi:hypothetical protein C8R46DRAFT_1092683 [Mycena filopes]|nr:hypothetical protein C8R46DRAFT_1092683 [Mycena filopes]
MAERCFTLLAPSVKATVCSPTISNLACRHPNFVQLCGVTTSSLVHATIFHDDLIPLENFLELYQNSPLLTVYVHAYCSTEFWEANDYFSSVSRQRLCITECTFWIRRSTGKLCADLISTNMGHRVQSPHPDCSSYEIGFSQVPNQQIKTVDSLSVEKYHEICYWDVSQVRHMHMCTPVTVNLGAVISWSSTRGEETLLTIASLPCVDLPERRWHITRGPRGVVVDGWTRFRVEEVMNHTLRVHIWHWNPECWLSQANYIFDCLQLEPDAHDCVIVDNITFSIPIQALPDDYLDLYLPTLSPNELETRRRRCEGGYLFLCPVNDFRTGPCSFRAPDLPAYWSLGPSGVNRLSPEDANRLGFPSLQLATTVQGKSWDRQTYAELGRFHRAKGFDPTSQDVARYLGDPLYYLPQEDASSGRDECPEDDAAADRKAQQHQPPEVSSVSPMFKLVMNVQLTLIIFLMVSWLNSWRG